MAHQLLDKKEYVTNKAHTCSSCEVKEATRFCWGCEEEQEKPFYCDLCYKDNHMHGYRKRHVFGKIKIDKTSVIGSRNDRKGTIITKDKKNLLARREEDQFAVDKGVEKTNYGEAKEETIKETVPQSSIKK